MKKFSEFLEEKDNSEGNILKSTVTNHMKTLPHVTAKYDSIAKEWEIKHKGDKQGNTSYFTNDHKDAMTTASLMNSEKADKYKK